MIDEMDKLLGKLAAAPLPSGLDRLEADVLRRIASSRAETIVAPSWQIAAVGLALVAGIGVGATSGIAVRDAPGRLAQAVSGGDLGPSSLLGSS